MTHSLHRRGDQESLEGDYVVLLISAGGINDKGSAKNLREALNRKKLQDSKPRRHANWEYPFKES